MEDLNSDGGLISKQVRIMKYTAFLFTLDVVYSAFHDFCYGKCNLFPRAILRTFSPFSCTSPF
jgi:hypothetical protein